MDVILLNIMSGGHVRIKGGGGRGLSPPSFWYKNKCVFNKRTNKVCVICQMKVSWVLRTPDGVLASL